MKVITICGSLKFEQEMKYYAEKLEFEGNCVLSIVYPIKKKEEYTQEEINSLRIGHFKRIELADVIFVVNKNGYIGDAVKKEIEFAKRNNKKIVYLENTNEEIIEKINNNYMEISFPKNEYEVIKKFLDEHGYCYTTRVYKETNKYKDGELYKAPWGDVLKINEITKYRKLSEHPFYDKITKNQKKIILKYSEDMGLQYEWIKFSRNDDSNL
jgi:hypothetical protein